MSSCQRVRCKGARYRRGPAGGLRNTARHLCSTAAGVDRKADGEATNGPGRAARVAGAAAGRELRYEFEAQPW